MGFTAEQKLALNAKLDISNVKTRTQSGQTLSYVEGWHVIAEANRIFGEDAWSRETVYLKEVCRYQSKNKYGKDQWKVGYEAKVRVTVDGIAREGTGYGQGTMGDLFDAMESAGKEAETDAMKRALMTFGNPFGLALYDKSKSNVDASEHETVGQPTPSQARQWLLDAFDVVSLRTAWEEIAHAGLSKDPELVALKDKRKEELS